MNIDMYVHAYVCIIGVSSVLYVAVYAYPLSTYAVLQYKQVI